MSDSDNMRADSRGTSQSGTYLSLRTGLAALASGASHAFVTPSIDRARASRQLFAETAGPAPAPAVEESLTGLDAALTPSPGMVPPLSYRRIMDDTRANLLATQNLLAERGLDLAAARTRIATLENALDQRRAREEAEVAAREAQTKLDAERAREEAAKHAERLLAEYQARQEQIRLIEKTAIEKARLVAEQHARELAEHAARVTAEQQQVREAATRAEIDREAREAAATAATERARQEAVRTAEVAREAAERQAREAAEQAARLAAEQQRAREAAERAEKATKEAADIRQQLLEAREQAQRGAAEALAREAARARIPTPPPVAQPPTDTQRARFLL
jgi:hypothetical protein